MNKIIKALSSKEESERLYAVQDIIALKDSPNSDKTDGYVNEADTYAETLVRHLEHETSQAVRDSIVYALKLMPCTKAFTLLFELFQNPDAYLRNAAVTVFGTKGVDGVAFLTSLLDHADREVRKLVIDSLFQIGSKEDAFRSGAKEAVLAIRAGLNDPSINVRITAVEYLGQLNDTQSVEDILDMLQNEKDPMLITAALETILQIGDQTNIQDTINFLSHNALDQKDVNADVDILNVHPVFLPEFIKLAAKCGTVENIVAIVEFLHGKKTYSKDIVSAIQDMSKRDSSILYEDKIKNFIIDTIKDSEMAENVRYAAAEIVLDEYQNGEQILFFNKKMYLDMGRLLIKEPLMLNAGLRFLSKSETIEGREMIDNIKAATKDVSLLALCDDLGL